ncbi:MAG TPA: hypothetical protein ENN84_01785, partial [Candidatus Marinimicrobia bacterium]|nr:hypothetical protein [Candidatus Neomarinimicrobiota bacterium]
MTKIPARVFVAEIELNNPHLSIQSLLAQDHLPGLERCSSILKRQPESLGEPVVAINGDFFNANGHSVNAQIIFGELVKRPHYRSVFALSHDRRPYIGKLIYDGFLVRGKNKIQISGINEQRRENDLILYNKYFGPVTRTNRWGSEAILNLLEGKSAVNRPFKALVQSLII